MLTFIFVSVIRFIFHLFKGEDGRVIAFVGKSGTGKSYRAKPLAKKMKAELIIDDGLLIEGDKMLAGHSAKTESTFFAAIRTCLFEDKKHRDEVMKMLEKKSNKRVLILGTSEKMIAKIVSRLQLPSPCKIIRIEEVSTKEEITDALRSRNMEGKHVIPLPSKEVKKNYPKIFYEKVRLFFKMKARPVIPATQGMLFEKSVVKPAFFKREIQRVPIHILIENIKMYIREWDANIVVKEIQIHFESKGYIASLVVDYPFCQNIAYSIVNLQKHITEEVEKKDGTLIANINIVIDKMISGTSF